MSARLNPFAAAPEMVAAMTAFENAVASSGLEHSLIELVKTRASQINGCASGRSRRRRKGLAVN